MWSCSRDTRIEKSGVASVFIYNLKGFNFFRYDFKKMTPRIIFSIDSFLKNNIFYKNYCLKHHSMLARRVITADKYNYLLAIST